MSRRQQDQASREIVSPQRIWELFDDYANQVYVVQDACDAPEVVENVRSREDESVSLYSGKAWSDYRDIGPYLLKADEELLRQVVEWGDRPWGFLLITAVDLSQVRHHLRRFLTVIDPQGDRLYFRFYDPRVLLSYLHSCTPTEVSRFLGPMQYLLIPTEPGAFECVTTPSAGSERTRTNATFPLHIRPEQMEALGQPLAASFQQRMAQREREFFPDRAAGYSDGELLEFIQKCTDDALAHRIELESDVEAYLDLCMNFDCMLPEQRAPWITEILEHPSRAAADKLDMIRSRIVFAEK